MFASDARNISAARSVIGFGRVQVSASEIRLDRGQALTLNGIAQGWAADRIATMLGRLPVEETAEQPETRLQKRFIHHLLMEIDDRVAAWPEGDTDAAPGTDAASPPPPPSPLP